MSLRPCSLLLALLAALLAGCASSPLRSNDPIARELAATQAQTVKPPAATVDDEKPIKIQTQDKSRQETQAEVVPGSGSFVDEQAARAPAPGGGAAPPAEGQITFNFENQPIQAVVQAILGALLKENYTIAPNVTGNVTFSTSRPITPEQALPILEMLLSWTNNALVRKEGRYEVLPVKDAIPGNLTPRIAPPNLAKGYEVRVFPLKYISATEMQKLLKPFARAEAVVAADNARSMLIMAGTASELANYQRTIEVFDVDWLKGMSVGVYSLRNTDVTKIQPELDKVFGSAGESPLAGMFRFIPMESTNSIVVITSQPEYLKKAETWLYRLDVGAGENGTQLYVYDVKNVKAIDLSDHLNAIFTGQVSQRSSTAGGNVAPGLRPVTVGAVGATVGGGGALGQRQTNYPMGMQPQGKALAVGAPGAAGGATPNLTTTGTGAPSTAAGAKQTDIRITPIEENNQLLVMATPAEWDSILAAIHRLDIAPLQVQIETKILEVSLTGNLQYGVQWWLAGLINTKTGGSDSSTGFDYGPGFQGNPADRHRVSLGASGTAAPISNGGLFYSFLNKNLQVALNALETSGNTKVLSAPSMVVLNNQPASINVGTSVPILQTSIVGITGLTSGTTTPTPVGGYTNTGIGSTTYIQTGVMLTVTPRVNPGGLVYLDVSQEVSSPGTATAGSNPPINQRQLETQVAVQSGQTVLLGGLIQENDTDSQTGVPGLARIPLLGRLFGNTSNSRQRTELIVLITPRVINTPDDAVQVTQEYQQKFESLAPLRAKSPPAETVPPPAPPAPEPQSKSQEGGQSEK